MPLDSTTAKLLGEFAAAGARPLHELTPTEARNFGADLRKLYAAGPDMERVESVRIQSDSGGFGARVLVPCRAPRGVVIYYHGGGWVIGGVDEFDALGRSIAKATSSAVVLVDYRLAPEYPFPTAVDDAYVALEWVAANLALIAGRDVPLIVAGDSAGGNLAAVTALRSRERGGPSILQQILIYPVTDADFNRPSYLDPANQLLLTRASMAWFWGHYAPDTAIRSHPDASPLRARSLANLPPALVLTAEFDPLRDEGERYAARLVEAGVPVEFRRYSGQMHGFFTLYSILPASAAGIAQVARFIDSGLTDAAAAAARMPVTTDGGIVLG